MQVKDSLRQVGYGNKYKKQKTSITIVRGIKSQLKFFSNKIYKRGRHTALSVVTATQVWKALASECRKQATAPYIFKLRNYADLDGLAEELGAVHPDGKKGVLSLYRRAVAEPYGFLYCDLLAKDPNKIFHNKDFEPMEL